MGGKMPVGAVAAVESWALAGGRNLVVQPWLPEAEAEGGDEVSPGESGKAKAMLRWRRSRRSRAARRTATGVEGVAVGEWTEVMCKVSCLKR